LRLKFGIKKVCIVADRGMLSTETVQELEANKRGWCYILGARLRNVKEVREQVLGRGGRYTVVDQGDREPLRVKEVKIDDRRYILCLNEAQRSRDEAARAAILESLAKKLGQGDKGLVGNSGYRRYLTKGGKHFEIDRDAIARERRYDGKWVLRTNTDWSAAEVALRYKQLWMVEHTFRDLKSLMQTRPVFHRTDEAIRGHVFCSFLALVVRNELMERVAAIDSTTEWNDVVRDLGRVAAMDVSVRGQTYRVRSGLQGAASVVFKALKLAAPPTIQKL
jgi:transposase